MLFPTRGILKRQRYTFYLLCTLRPPFLTNDQPKVILYCWEFLSWFSTLLPLHMTICYLKTVLDDEGNYDLLTFVNFAMESVWFLFSFLGMVHYKTQAKPLAKLLDEIEATFKWRSPSGRSYVDMGNTFKVANYIGTIWQFLPPTFVLFSVLMPLFIKPTDPQPWYPLNQEHAPLYYLSVFLQGWAKMIMVFSFASGSSFFVSFCLLICGQFNILRCSLKNLIYTSGIYERFKETQVKFTSSDVLADEYTLCVEKEDAHFPLFKMEDGSDSAPSQKLDLTLEEIQKFHKALKSCIEHHHVILQICRKTEDFFNLFAFYRVAEMTLQICFLAYLYPKVNTMIPFSYLVMTLVDIFLITYPSQHVQWHNESLGGAILLGPWHLVSKYFYRDFIIIMSQTCRPIKFTAMKILNLDVSCLKGVVTTAFSYYTLLTKFEN